MQSIEELCRAERRRAQDVFALGQIVGFDHPDSAEEDADDVPFERDFESADRGIDTAPTLKGRRL